MENSHENYKKKTKKKFYDVKVGKIIPHFCCLFQLSFIFFFFKKNVYYKRYLKIYVEVKFFSLISHSFSTSI